MQGRSPYGERGLKYVKIAYGRETCQSLSLRRAWIEMLLMESGVRVMDSRSPYGERGLKYTEIVGGLVHDRRSPYGERGLKCKRKPNIRHGLRSLSLRRAWIEIEVRSLNHV